MSQDASKIYPCWRIYQVGEKLPVMTFHNGRSVDLSQSEVLNMLDKMADDEMLMFYEHLYYGRYQQCNGGVEYLFGSNFSITKNDDGSVCIFGNGCSFDM